MTLPKWARVAEAIRSKIRSGDYPPGTLLPSYRLLEEEHGASYGPVRMAMMVLRTEGWVEGEPGVGVRVRADHPE